MASRRLVAVLAAGLVAAALLATGLLLAESSSGPSAQASSMPQPPRLGRAGVVIPGEVGDFGDPFVLRVGSSEVLFGTDTPPWRVPTAYSTARSGWTRGSDALPRLPAWAAQDPTDSHVWGPAVAQIGARFVLYITVPVAAGQRECIAATTSSRVLGPYHDALGHPFICQSKVGVGSIDPTVFRDRSGALHIAWKSDGVGPQLWASNLASDGLHTLGPPHPLLGVDEPWQAGVLENPALLPASPPSSGWWLFYSAGHYDRAGYSTGLAWCPTLEGPCHETSQKPYLSGSYRSAGRSQYSPGGMDFYTDAHGHTWAAFATWDLPPRNGLFYCCRALNVAPVY